MKAIYKLSIAVLAGVALGAVAVQGIRAQAKPPVYVVAEIDVTDPATYQTYVDRNGPLVQSFGGRFLTRGGKTEAIAGPPPRGRVAIYMFENMEKMQAWRDSPQYKELIAIRDKSSNFRSFAIEGSDHPSVAPLPGR
jgi:uncharacterized protein (DUF1330 family)